MQRRRMPRNAKRASGAVVCAVALLSGCSGHPLADTAREALQLARLGRLVRRMSARQKKEIVVKVEQMAPNQSTVQCAPPMPETPFIIPEQKTEIRAKKPERRSSRQEKGQAVKQPVPKMEIPNILKELETGGCA